MVWPQPLLMTVLPIRVTVTLLQQRSIQAGGLVGIGLPQGIVKLLHSSTGTDGNTVTTCVQITELLQQSKAFHTCEITCPQPVPLVCVSMGMIVRLVQQALADVGGSKVQAVPHATVLLVAQVISGGVVTTGDPRMVPEKSVTPPVTFRSVSVRAGINWNVRSTCAVSEAARASKFRLAPG